GGGAAAEAHQEGAGTGVDGGAHQLDEPARGGGARGELAAGEGVETDGLGELEHRHVLPLCPAGGPGLAGGAGDGGAAGGEAGGERGVDGAVPAVGDGAGQNAHLRRGPCDAAVQRVTDLGGGQGALELVRGE